MELRPGPILYIAMVLPTAMLYLSVRHHISIEQNRLRAKKQNCKNKANPISGHFAWLPPTVTSVYNRSHWAHFG